MRDYLLYEITSYMRLKLQTIFYHLQKLFIYVACFFVIVYSSCNRDNRTVNLSESSSGTNYNVIDSLINRISNDTLALSNYLKLAITTDDTYAMMMTYNQLGLYYQQNFSFLKAIEYHKNYLDVAETSNDRLQEVKALNTLGNDYIQIYALNESSEYYFKALSLLNQFEEINDPHVQSVKAVTLNGLGNIYLRSDQPDEALNYLKASLKIDIQNNNIDGQANNLANIGSSFEQKMQYDSASLYYNKALDYSIKANSVSGISTCFEQIGNLYMIEGDYLNASVYLESAYNTLHHTSDKLNWLNCCFSVANLKIIMGYYKEAKSYLEEGLKVANKLNLPDYLERAHGLLSELQKQEGNTTAALEEQYLSDIYGNAFQNEKNNNRIMWHRINYEKEMNNQEIIHLTEQHRIIEKRKQTTINTILFIITILVGMMIIIIQNYNLRMRKKEATLQLEKLKSSFYINISHEFKTPVNIIMGLVERLKKHFDNESSYNDLIDLDILSRQSENLYLLIDEIASIATVQENEKPPKTVNDNVVAYLQYLYECFSPLIEIKKIDYLFHSNVSDLRIDYIPEYLRIIMNNLLSNAIKHCSEKDTISVKVNYDNINKYYTVEVSDTGESISEKDMPYIFNMFYRGTNDRTFKNGSGIGLSFTKKLVERLNGRIEVKSDPGKETIFIVTLPILNEQISSQENRITIHQSPLYEEIMVENRFDSSAQNKENPVLLIAGGNKDMSHYLASVLGDKYNVLIATNGKAAFETANEKIPDLIVSDVMMSQMDGFELCKEIKNTNATNHIPFILLAVINSKEERVQGFRCGADAFLPKPVYEDELMAIIEQLLFTRKQIRDKYAQVMMNYDKNSYSNEIKNDINMEFLQRVTDLIYREIDHSDNIIEVLSSEVCLSSSQLNRKIKAITGLTTSNYILKVRLNKAKKHLIKSQKPIGEIAMECGFNDFAYFSRSFKKEFGMTPTSFQRLPHSVN